MQLLSLIIITSLFLYGTKVLFQPFMLLHPVKLWLDGVFGNSYMLAKPIYACPPCMSSIWGSLIYWLCSTWNIYNACMWPVFCVAVAGITSFLLQHSDLE